MSPLIEGILILVATLIVLLLVALPFEMRASNRRRSQTDRWKSKQLSEGVSKLGDYVIIAIIGFIIYYAWTVAF